MMILLVVAVALLVVVLALQFIILSRRSDAGGASLAPVVEDLVRAQERVERSLREQIAESRSEASTAARQAREELATALKTVGDTLDTRVAAIGGASERQLEAMRSTLEQRLQAVQTGTAEDLARSRHEASAAALALRETVDRSLKNAHEGLVKTLSVLADAQKTQLESFSKRVADLTLSTESRLETLRGTVDERMRAIQEDNAKKLEQMRLTVDEKLQTTLEGRLSQSFSLVTDQLTKVSKELGEMQTLAAGVGDLKRVLTNVKTRGTWGEVQLEALLEQVLTTDQYARNVDTKQNGMRVEFAVRLPGRGEDADDVVWLPIDAKFPVEDWQRLVEAQERADATAADAASRGLEIQIKACARDISEKYIGPPSTTDFGILFLPTEGLFAEVVRRPGLAEAVQREHRVMIAGPTTLFAVLSSLRMGFRTLAIQRRSSEVWKLLGAVKTEFDKFGDLLAKVHQKLEEATRVIDTDVARRSRVIRRKLNDVQALPTAQSGELLRLDEETGFDEAEE